MAKRGRRVPWRAGASKPAARPGRSPPHLPLCRQASWLRMESGRSMRSCAPISLRAGAGSSQSSQWETSWLGCLLDGGEDDDRSQSRLKYWSSTASSGHGIHSTVRRRLLDFAGTVSGDQVSQHEAARSRACNGGETGHAIVKWRIFRHATRAWLHYAATLSNGWYEVHIYQHRSHEFSGVLTTCHGYDKG